MANKTTQYKQTEIGLIPVEWEVKRLGDYDVTTKIGDGLHGTPNYIFSSEYYFINGNNLRDHKIEISENTKCITRKEYELLNKKLNDKTLLISINGTIGSLAFYKNEKVALGKSVAYINFTNLELLKFSTLYFQSEKVHLYFENELTGSTIRNLSLKSIRELQLPIPPLPEQQRIATILSTWDDAIDKTKKIIAALVVRNKGLAQRLLSGKKRGKGFEESKWELLPINKIAKEVSKKNNTDKALIVLSCTKYLGLIPSLEYFGRKIYSDNLTTYKIVEKNHFAYATNHIEEGSIGYQSKYEEALISPMYTVFKTIESINDDFLFRILKSHIYINQYQQRMEGSIDRRGGLRWDEFSKIKVPIISSEEQRSISIILDNATLELKQTQQKLAQLQVQKKGLMQVLLTGKVRTV